MTLSSICKAAVAIFRRVLRDNLLPCSVAKNPPANAGDTTSIPDLGRFPGEVNGNPLQYSCLEKPMDQGVWWAIVHGTTKSQTWQPLNNNKNKRSSSEFYFLFHLRLLRNRQLVACPRLLYQWQHQSSILSPAPRLLFLTRPFPKYLPHLSRTHSPLHTPYSFCLFLSFSLC